MSESLESAGSGRGLLVENIAQALDRVRARRLRAGLLILGIAIGVASIIAMVSLFKGISDQAVDEVFASGRPFLTVERFDFWFTEATEELLRRAQLTPEDARAVDEDCPSVEKVTFYRMNVWNQTVLRFGENRTDPIYVRGVGSDLPAFTSTKVVDGRFFSRAEVHFKKRVVVLGHDSVKALFPSLDPIGKTLDIGGFPYTVIGTLEKQSIFGDDNASVYVPHTIYSKDYATDDDYRLIWVLGYKGVDLSDLEDEVVMVLRQRRNVPPGAENDFVMKTSANYESQMDSFITSVNLAIVVIGLIGLIVGGIGVMNIMLISVTERTYEIGLRKSVGATRSNIMHQFLIESIGLTGLGGFAGILLGVATAWSLSEGFHLPLSLSVPWILVALAFAVVVGVLSGVFPAYRAARMDPVEALRKE